MFAGKAPMFAITVNADAQKMRTSEGSPVIVGGCLGRQMLIPEPHPSVRWAIPFDRPFDGPNGISWPQKHHRWGYQLQPQTLRMSRNPKGSNDTVRNPLRNCLETPTKRAYIVKLVYNYRGELRFMVHISVVDRFYKPFFLLRGTTV